MKKLITLEWELRDRRNMNAGCGYRTGISHLIASGKSYNDLINTAIWFASHLPSWEYERNNIDLEEYRGENGSCCYYNETKLSKILKIEDAK